MSEEKKGAPAWMISFGDMMTLILTFFILLVSMSSEQKEGLMAKGLGSFFVATRSFGLPGILDDAEEASIYNNVRRRFNLPPEEDPTRRTSYFDAANLELIRAKAAQSLKPHDELNQPGVAAFEPGSTELGQAARRYLDLLAPSLFPDRGQVLLLEGHATGEGSRGRWTAFERARVVREYLIEAHGFPPARVSARAWVREIAPDQNATRLVDARLIIPAPDTDNGGSSDG